MKKFFIGSFAIISLFCNNLLASESSPYLQANILYVQNNDGDLSDGTATDEYSYRSSYGFSLAGGLNITENIRAELEYGKNTSEVDSIDGVSTNLLAVNEEIDVETLMVNGYYDFGVSKKTDLYLGLGLGMAKVDSKDWGGGDDVFAYKISTGVAHDIGHSTQLVFGYNYFDSENVSLASVPGFSDLELELSSHQLQFGVRYNF